MVRERGVWNNVEGLEAMAVLGYLLLVLALLSLPPFPKPFPKPSKLISTQNNPMSLQEHPGSVGRIKLRLNFPRAESDRGLLPDASFRDTHLDFAGAKPPQLHPQTWPWPEKLFNISSVNFVD